MSGLSWNTVGPQIKILAERIGELSVVNEMLIKELKLIRDQDQGCGGNVSEVEAWKNAKAIAIRALAFAGHE